MSSFLKLNTRSGMPFWFVFKKKKERSEEGSKGERAEEEEEGG